MAKVSVFMITYGHEKYIRQAIESVLIQQTDFAFELVIGEDCGNDNTRAICEEYGNKYSHLINLLPSDRNYGPMGNTIRTLAACTGEYIAMCEGDDYWIDTRKLQKQVDFLECNPAYSMCFSDVEIVSELEVARRLFPVFTKDTYTIEDLILSEQNLIPTPTLLFRNLLPQPLPQFFTEALGGDMVIQLLIADKGKVKFMSEKMAVYRNHAAGMSKTVDAADAWPRPLMRTYKSANVYFKHKYEAYFSQRFFDITRQLYMQDVGEKKGYEKLRHYFALMPDYYKYASKLNLKEVLYYHLILFAPGLLKRRSSAVSRQ